MLFSQFSNAQITIPIGVNGLYIGGNIRFSPGDGFVFGRRGGSFSNSFNLNRPSPESYSPSAINYGWEYSNPNDAYSLKAEVLITSNTGNIIYKDEITYSNTSSFVQENYTYKIDSAEQPGGLKITFSANSANTKEVWSGPNVRNIYSEIQYELSSCTIDPLSSTTCPGYSQALIDKLCEINPRSCPGYSISLSPEISPLPDEGYAEITKSLENPSITLTQTTETKKNEVVNQTIQGNGLRINPPTQNTRTQIRIPQQSNKNEVDPQTERMDEIQQGGANISAYTSAVIKDSQFYRPREIYKNIVIPDNVRVQRQLTQRSNISHGRMVDEQYR